MPSAMSTSWGLTYVEEQGQQGWAKHMREQLLDIEQTVKAQDRHNANLVRLQQMHFLFVCKPDSHALFTNGWKIFPAPAKSRY